MSMLRTTLCLLMVAAACSEVHHVGMGNAQKVSLYAHHHDHAALTTKAHYVMTFRGRAGPASRQELQDMLGGKVEYVPHYTYKVFATLQQLINMQQDKQAWRVKSVSRLQAHHKELHTKGHNVLHVHYSDKVPTEEAVMVMQSALEKARVKATIRRVTEDKYRVLVAGTRHGMKAATALRNLEAVRWVCDQPEASVLNDIASSTIQSNLQGHFPLTTNPSGVLAGSGEIVMVADTGVDYASCFFSDDNNDVSLYPEVNMNHRKIVSYRQCLNEFTGEVEHLDGHGHGTHVCGSLAGYPPADSSSAKHKGLAYEAKVFVTDLSCNAGGSLDIPIDLFAFYNGSYEMGSRVSHNSWGTHKPDSYVSIDGETDEYIFEHSDYVVVAAAGNGGVQGVLSPASAKNIISVGAHVNSYIESDRSVIPSFSAIGPTWDQRIKPEILAPGKDIESALKGTACGTSFKHGTSMAAPFVSASAAILRQYFREGWYPAGRRASSAGFNPSSTLIKALIIHSGRRSDTPKGSTQISNVPNAHNGWGALSLGDIMYFSTGEAAKMNNHIAIVNNATLMQNGLYEATYKVTGKSSQSFGDRIRVTLVWNDPAAAIGATQSLVNDLDLVVQTADGLITAKGTPAEGAFPDLDNVNVVEQVELDLPAGGLTFRVMVYGRHVPEVHPYDGLPFSFVVSGPSIQTAPWTGDCPAGCNSRGSCVEGRCVCDTKFHHTDCSVCDSELHCNGNGECHDELGTCECHGNWEGERCDACKSGWYGSDCDIDCNCNGHGQCTEGAVVERYCNCRGNWGGASCTHCIEGFRGTNCEVPSHFCDTRGTVAVANEQIGYIQINALREYENSVVCKWTIAAPESTMGLRLTFIEFDIEAQYDHVFVYDGQVVPGDQVAVWDGVAGLNQVVTTGNTASIVFESDLEGPKTGFAMKFETVSPGGCTPSTCFGKGVCESSPNPYYCKCDANYDPAKYCSACVAGKVGTNCMFEATPAPTSGPIVEGSHCVKDGVECSGDGWCDAATKECVCAHTVGPYCETGCPGRGSLPESKCSGHGVCVMPGECQCEQGYSGMACQLQSANIGGAAGYMSEVLRGPWELIAIDDTATHVEISIEMVMNQGKVVLGLWDAMDLAGLSKYAKVQVTTEQRALCYVLELREPQYFFGLYVAGSDVIPVPFTVRTKKLGSLDTPDLLTPCTVSGLPGDELVQLATAVPTPSPPSYDFVLPIGLGFLLGVGVSLLVVYLIARYRRSKKKFTEG